MLREICFSFVGKKQVFLFGFVNKMSAHCTELILLNSKDFYKLPKSKRTREKERNFSSYKLNSIMNIYKNFLTLNTAINSDHIFSNETVLVYVQFDWGNEAKNPHSIIAVDVFKVEKLNSFRLLNLLRVCVCVCVCGVGLTLKCFFLNSNHKASSTNSA